MTGKMAQWVDFTVTTFGPEFGSSVLFNSQFRQWAETSRSSGSQALAGQIH